MLKLKLQYFDHLMRRAGHWKRPWAGSRRRGWEDELIGEHCRLKGQEFEQTLGDSEGQGSLAYHSSCGHKELDRTIWLNNNNKAFSNSVWATEVVQIAVPSYVLFPLAIVYPALCNLILWMQLNTQPETQGHSCAVLWSVLCLSLDASSLVCSLIIQAASAFPNCCYLRPVRPPCSTWILPSCIKGFCGDSDVEESACSAGDPSSIPVSGRSPGEGNGYPF